MRRKRSVLTRNLGVSAALVLATAVPVCASGGIYFDDFLVTNNGATVLSDSFDDGDVSDWRSINDATLSTDRSHSPSYSMHLNWHGGPVAHAYRQILVAQAGLVEASAWVWLPPASEQYKWNHNTISFTGIYLYSQNTNDNIFAHVEERPGETGYRLYLGWNQSGGPGASFTTSGAVISPGQWSLLTFRLDSANSIASALVNGQQKASLTYNSSNFGSLNNTSFWGWLGDGVQPVPEPSSLLALFAGLAGVGGAVWRGRSRRR